MQQETVQALLEMGCRCTGVDALLQRLHALDCLEVVDQVHRVPAQRANIGCVPAALEQQQVVERLHHTLMPRQALSCMRPVARAWADAATELDTEPPACKTEVLQQM